MGAANNAPPVALLMPLRTGNFPPLVRERLEHLCQERHVPMRVLVPALVRAVVTHPPRAPTAYPTLDTATGHIRADLPQHLYDAEVLVEQRFFYHRFAWLVFYGASHHAKDLDTLLSLGPDQLAQLDAAAYNTLTSEVPCLVPLTARAPKAPSSAPPSSSRRGPSKVP